MIDWVKDESGLSLRVERRQTFTIEPHVMKATRGLPWLRCTRCGLLNLRNSLTVWCLKAGCNAADHPEYASRCKHSAPK